MQHLDEVDGGDADGLWAAGVDHVQEGPCLAWLYECVPQRGHAPSHLAENHLLISGLLRGFFKLAAELILTKIPLDEFIKVTIYYLYRDGLLGRTQVARSFCLALHGCCLAKQVHNLVHFCSNEHTEIG